MSTANEAPLADPLAYFLTWATYGTWLPGDERGWVDYHHGWQEPNPVLEQIAAASLTEDPCVFDPEQRELVEQNIRDHCQIRGWTLHAVNCRTTHLHVIVTANRHPDEVRDQLKAWCTRKLKELEVCRAHTNPTRQRGSANVAAPTSPTRERGRIRTHWWAERGSKRYLNDPDSLEAAILYVRDGQDQNPTRPEKPCTAISTLTRRASEGVKW